MKRKINLELKHDTEEFTSTSNNNNTEVIYMERKHVSKATTLAQKFSTKVKSKQVPQQRRKECKPHKSQLKTAATTPKFCPKVFFSQVNQFVPNLFFKCTDLL